MSIEVLEVEHMQDDELLTVNQAAEIMKVHSGTIRSWVKKGELVAVPIGRREYRIRWGTLKEFIKGRERNLGVG